MARDKGAAAERRGEVKSVFDYIEDFAAVRREHPYVPLDAAHPVFSTSGRSKNAAQASKRNGRTPALAAR